MGLLVIFVKKRNFEGCERWAGPSDVPLEAWRHFRDEELSIYRVPTEGDLPRLIAAFALQHRDRLESKDFLAVDEGLVDLSGYDVKDTPGDVPDAVVREWHRSVRVGDENTAKTLTQAFAGRGYCRRVTLGLVKSVVLMAHDQQFFIAQKLSAGVKRDLEKVIRGAQADDPCQVCGHRVIAHGNVEADVCDICSLVTGTPCGLGRDF